MGSFNIEYTKHYYIEGQRIASKIGAGLSPSIVRPDYKVEPITGDTYEAISEHLRKLCEVSDYCVGFNGKYAYYGKELKCINPLLNLDDNEKNSYFYHSDYIGSSSFITDASGIASQYLQYLPFGELFVEQRSTANYYTPYKFSAKEKDEETSYSYFGARYYLSDISIWASVDPMRDKRSWLSPYNYCQLNPIKLTDPSGMLDDGYTIDENGNTERVDNTGGDKYDVLYNKKDYDSGKRDYDRSGTKNGIQIDRGEISKLKSVKLPIDDDGGIRQAMLQGIVVKFDLKK